jgi:hypothetical protein
MADYSEHYSIIYVDLLEMDPTLPSFPSRPYSASEKYADKIQRIYDLLIRAASLRQRLRILAFAFYLGELIYGPNTTKIQRLEVKQMVSAYYYQAAIRVYRIFELDKLQIYRTRQMALYNVSKLRSAEYQMLCSEEVFPGGSN